jgi:hypothetical protein
MKKLVLAIFLAQSIIAHAASEYYDWDHPTKPFNARVKERSSVRVDWRTVDNVRETCSKMMIASGNGPIKFSIYACSVMNGNICTIVTEKDTSMHTLGHELRHCFQGAWHGDKVN